MGRRGGYVTPTTLFKPIEWQESTISYDKNLPTEKDKVRLLIGDNIESDEFLADSEIQYIIDDEEGNLLDAAARCCDVIANKASRDVDFTASTLSLSASDVSDHYRDAANKLREEASKGIGSPLFLDSKDSGKTPKPIFTIGMHDFVDRELDEDE